MTAKAANKGNNKLTSIAAIRLNPRVSV